MADEDGISSKRQPGREVGGRGSGGAENPRRDSSDAGRQHRRYGGFRRGYRRTSQSQPGEHPHAERTRKVILFENPHAAGFSEPVAERFSAELASKGFVVERRRPKSAHDMAVAASDARTERPWAMIAAGGDGAVNLVARSIVGSPIRFGALPLGRFNNFFRSLIGPPSPKTALAAIIAGDTVNVDCGKVSGQPFFTAFALGFIPTLAEALARRSSPGWGLTWSRLAARVASETTRAPLGLRIDSRTFEISPLLMSVHLLSHAVGLPFAPSANPDDRRFEVIVDIDPHGASLSRYVRDVFKRRYLYDDGIHLYRAQEISVGPVRGAALYVDGELITAPINALDVTFYSGHLRALVPPRSATPS